MKKRDEHSSLFECKQKHWQKNVKNDNLIKEMNMSLLDIKKATGLSLEKIENL